MREPTIARNYAQALFEAGERSGETERFAAMLEAVAGAIEAHGRSRLGPGSPPGPQAAQAAGAASGTVGPGTGDVHPIPGRGGEAGPPGDRRRHQPGVPRAAGPEAEPRACRRDSRPP